MSTLPAMIADFRRRLLRAERSAAAALTAAYGNVWSTLQADITALEQQIAVARTAGQPIKRSWLIRQLRYRQLIERLNRELYHWVSVAEQQINDAQQAAMVLADAQAAQLIQAQSPERVFIVRVPREATIALLGALQQGSPLREILDELVGDAAASFAQQLINGLVLGQSPRRTAQQLRQALGAPLARALTITRTSTLSAYREASLETYRANAHQVRGYRWLCTLSPRTCAMCWAMHGTEHPLDAPFATHPNCRCTLMPVLRLTIPIETGVERFKRLNPTQQLAILGPAKFAAYTTGRIGLADVVGYRVDPRWGPTRYEQSLKRIQGG